MAIFLIRHGETASNAARIVQTPEVPLSARGVAQAEQLGRRLAGLGVGAIVSSDLRRAVMTAERVQAFTGAPITLDAGLQERNFGDLRGRSYDSLGFDPLTLDAAPPGGESAAAFRARVARAFAHVVALRGELQGDLVVVTHGLVIGAMLAAHARLGAGIPMPERLGNASLTILDPSPPHTVSLLDHTAHLDAVAADDPQSLSGG